MTLPYIVNVALILAACLAFYKVLLRRETFYKVNRFLLIGCLAISFALPLLQVPQQFSLRKPVTNRQLAIGQLANKQSKSNCHYTISSEQSTYCHTGCNRWTSNQPQTSNVEPQTDFLSQQLMSWLVLGVLVWRLRFCRKFSFPVCTVIISCLAQPGYH